VHLRLIEEKDLPVCRELRNTNREWFYNSGVISEEQHRVWYTSVKDKRSFYVIELEGKVVGTISAVYKDGMTELGNLTLDNRYRGLGLMTQAVSILTQSPGTYFATTLIHNVKSQQVFERCGFKREGLTEDGNVLLKLIVSPRG
jgi:RimJ/RimL family protein N-acetyltransferase